MTTEITKRLDLAYSKLGMREPFIAAVMTRVKREVTEKVPTAGTNGTHAFYNPEFCEKQSNEELFGLVLHESCHVVLMHMWRRERRDPALWNVANDAIINAYVRSRGYELPAGGVHISWVEEKHSSEFVYNKLKQEQEQEQGKGKGEGGSGDGEGSGESGAGDGSGSGNSNNRPAGGFDGTGDLIDATDDATEADMEATILAAAKMARECGQGTSMADRVIDAAGTSRVHWQDVMRSMLTEASAADYTYRRPSRRFIGSGMYLPSLYSDALGGLVIGFDTSGSMSQGDCNQVAAEIQAIVDDLSPAFVEVIYCDSTVTATERFDQGDIIKLSPKGGGGTRFKPVFEHIGRADDRYCGLVYFTDMEGDLGECDDPYIPVVWADIGSRHPMEPFGTRVEVQI